MAKKAANSPMMDKKKMPMKKIPKKAAMEKMKAVIMESKGKC